MKSVSVKLVQKENSNCSKGTIDDSSLREGVKILIVGLPQTGKTLLLNLLREKLVDIGVPEENIQVDSLDSPFEKQQRQLSLLLEEDNVIEELKKGKYSFYEVHQSYAMSKRLA